MRWIILFLAGLSHSALSQVDDGSKVVCYVRASSLAGISGSWLRQRDSALVPCTHIIFSYTKLVPTSTDVSNSSALLLDPSHENGLKSLVEWRERRQPELRIMFQLGSNEDVELYSEMTSSPSNRRTLIQNVLDFCREYNLDGVDLHWTYPQKKEPPEKHNYVSLAQELRKRLEDELRCRTMSIVIPQARDLIIPGFNLLFLNAVVDFFSLLAYNFNPGATKGSYHHSPLTLPADADVKDRSLTAMMRLYLRVGAIAQKLVLGVPLFGNMYDADQQKIIEKEIPANEICRMDESHGWNKEGDTIFGPQLKNEAISISYDDINSVEEKVNLINMFKLGGVMFWTMDMDDWNATCPLTGISTIGNGKNWPLISTGNVTLKREITTTPPDIIRETERQPVAPFAFSFGGVPSLSSGVPAPGPVNTPAGYSTSSFYNPSENQFTGPTNPDMRPPQQSASQPFFQQNSLIPNIKLIEAGKDIVIEDFQIQVNENHFYNRRAENVPAGIIQNG